MRTAVHIRDGVAFLALAITCGCGTMPKKYIPSQTGAMGKQEIVNGLSISIAAKTDDVFLGQPIYFDVTISNASDAIFWVPKEPFIIFAWTYPNGRRDNFIAEYPSEQFFRAGEAIKIHPGGTHQTHTRIPTTYFPAKGVTEFKAIYTSPRNTNPDMMPFWNGKMRSNGYGVTINKR